MVAGNVVVAAQQHWLSQALDGPVVLSPQAETALGEPGAARALGLTVGQVEQLRADQLDMGAPAARTRWTRPTAAPGSCTRSRRPAALECRNAFVLPSNLPQLLLFANHLERLRLRLSPPHFHSLWGQSRVNVAEAISARTDAEIALTRSGRPRLRPAESVDS
ncbi:hypothetical protein GCM10018980_74270 [Streptomyces capoamus]|uniref:Uncharacterized protein n=1 Tax=Streptomyces capoamus TaxID=68183 RepID=A0A919F3S9_9ACTN|nr:hypothetical protein [Streptomyces capoamus]GGP32707.1 hypothetical protein GCM10010501_75590 [Streptomyces libani subsp. rufus]GHG76380.1 hypothetical protein GCM10018980_74270 [Streptomyces capoamus]